MQLQTYELLGNSGSGILPSKILIFQKDLLQDLEKTLFEQASDFYKKGCDILSFFVPTVLAAGAIFHARKPNVVARLGKRKINGLKIFLKCHFEASEDIMTKS